LTSGNERWWDRESDDTNGTRYIDMYFHFHYVNNISS